MRPVIPLRRGQTLTVGQNNCDFNANTSSTPITDAINFVTDATDAKEYILLLHPGTYIENVVMKDYVHITGLGGAFDTIITSVSGTTVTFPSNRSYLGRVVVDSSPTANGAKAIDAPNGGSHTCFFVGFFQTSATNDITGTLLEASNGATFTFTESIGIYTMTGSGGGANTHDVIKINDTSSLRYFRSDALASVGDVDDTINLLNWDSTGSLEILTTLFQSTSTNGAYSGTSNLFKFTKSPSRTSIKGSEYINTSSGNGTGNIFNIDSTTNDAVVDIANNDIDVTGFATNYLATVATGDTLNINGNDIVAADGTTGAGVVNFFNTSADGQLEISGGAEFAIGTTNVWHAMSTLSTDIASETTLYAGSTGAITDTADNGGVLRVTDVDHGLTTGDCITLVGMGDPVHDGVTSVTVINSSTFDADNITYNSINDTGTWHKGAYIQVNKRGRYQLNWSFSMASAGNNKVFDFTAFKNCSVIPITTRDRKFGTAGDVGIGHGGGNFVLEKDDKIWFGFRNTTDATNITLSAGTVYLTKIS